MEIFELAAELGKKLKEDARLIDLEAAKKAYGEEPSLQKLMIEYEVQQRAMQAEVGRPEHDLHLIEAIQHRIDELYKTITEHPTYRELERAQNEVNELMNAVNNTIMTQITGEVPSSCTHNCSTCGGCH